MYEKFPNSTKGGSHVGTGYQSLDLPGPTSHNYASRCNCLSISLFE
jgi:hypothetical protein